MFKSLLRTLPSLSGNMQLCCILDNQYKKIRRTSYQRALKGYLIPLHNDYYNNKVNVNLQEDSHEWITQNFYKLYYNVFYSFTYDDSKHISENINRNIFFEYGCSRYFNKIVNKDFIFFAPIYIDNVNDIPTHFLIDISLDKDNKVYHQYINIDLTKSTTDYLNPLGDYLYKYVNKIDSKCIYINNESKGAIYEGIDLINGGFSAKEYLGLQDYINKHYPTDNFNIMINNGYESNCIINRQIIPLSFAFNLSDFGINDNEIVRIKGNYYNNNILLPLYDFDIRYNDDIFNINKVSFPCLGENSLYTNKENNKINIKCNKWKLYESNQNTPYITNNNYAYSDVDTHKYKYDKENLEIKLDYLYKNDLCKDIYDNINNVYTLTKIEFYPDKIIENQEIENYIDFNKINYNNYKVTKIKNYCENDNLGITVTCENIKSQYNEIKNIDVIYLNTKSGINLITKYFLGKILYYIKKYETVNINTHLSNIPNGVYAYSEILNNNKRYKVFKCKYFENTISIEYYFYYLINHKQRQDWENLADILDNFIKDNIILNANYDEAIISDKNSVLNNFSCNIELNNFLNHNYDNISNKSYQIKIDLSNYKYTKETINKKQFITPNIINDINKNEKNSYLYKLLNSLHLNNNFYNSNISNNHLKYNWYKTSVNKEIYINDLFIIQVPNANYYNIFICELSFKDTLPLLEKDFVTHQIDKIYDYKGDLITYEYYIIYHDKRKKYSGLFNLLQHNIDYIVNQNNNYLKILYKTTKNINNNEWYLSKLKNKMYFYLQRYFRNICPMFIQQNNIDIYYRNNNDELLCNNYNINYIEGDKSIDNFIEYKFFNTSKCINISHKIILECPVKFHEDDISKYEANDYVFSLFKSYYENKIKTEILNNSLSNDEINTTIRYIFNLYQYFFDKNKIDETNKIYTLKYKFLIK